MNAEPLALFLKFASYGTVQILHYLYERSHFNFGFLIERQFLNRTGLWVCWNLKF